MKEKNIYGTYFYGNEASEYAKEQGYLDYATFAKAFDAVLANDIISKTWDIGYWEKENGFVDNSEEIEELQEKLEELQEDSEEFIKIQERIEELECEQEECPDIYQYFIVSNNGAQLIKEYTNNPLFYNEELDLYVWGITHFGTSWSYVLTNVELNCGEKHLTKEEAKK